MVFLKNKSFCGYSWLTLHNGKMSLVLYWNFGCWSCITTQPDVNIVKNLQRRTEDILITLANTLAPKEVIVVIGSLFYSQCSSIKILKNLLVNSMVFEDTTWITYYLWSVHVSIILVLWWGQWGNIFIETLWVKTIQHI